MKERLAHRRERMQGLPFAVQIAVMALGAVFSIAGLIMLVTPGPAIVMIPLGLALISVRSELAKRAGDHFIDALQWIDDQPMKTKAALAVLALAAMAGAAFLILR